ncbi:MAG: hypothetical protein Q4F03_04930 [Eubacteriales bacterium]|nr:hypothetical protein [Eubacteriales bacterium]
MDLLFREYASPFILLDQMVSHGRLCEFITTFEESKAEKETWEFYIHKLPAWDSRTYDEFKSQVLRGAHQQQEKPSDEELETIIGISFDVLKDFKIEKEGG